MNMVRISIPLTVAEADRLVALAQGQRRKPSDQAAFMLAELLRTEEQRKPSSPSMKVDKELGGVK